MGRQQPFLGAGAPAGRDVNQPAVDARKLGARPEGSLLIRKVLRDTPVERQNPSERSIFQSRNPQGGNSVQGHALQGIDNFQQRPPRRENNFQQRPPQQESARYTDTQGPRTSSQAYQTGFTRDRTSFQTQRTTRDEGSPSQIRRTPVGRPRASRDSDDSEPRRRKPRAETGFGGDNRRGAREQTWTEEELQYLKEKAERKSPKAFKYEPLEFSRETFTGMGPATASDEWGMSEMLGERLLLARKYLDREFIQWDSKEQKADVMAVVEKLEAVRRGEKPIVDADIAETASPTSGNADKQAEAVMQKLIAGEYAKFKSLGGKDVLGHVERHVHRNDSFYFKDEKSLLEKVRSIIPAEQALKVKRGATTDLKV